MVLTVIMYMFRRVNCVVVVMLAFDEERERVPGVKSACLN